MASENLILGFDTSAAHCAAVLLHGDRVLSACHEHMARGQAERLFPLLQGVLAQAGVTWRDLTTVGVGIGPGNFTGIRISVAAARGLALSLDIPAVGVSALEAAAFGIDGPVTAVIDARRDRVYLQAFPDGAPTLAALAELPSGINVTGPAATLMPAAHLQPSAFPMAEAIARIAATRAGDTVPPPAPLYIRSADAAPARDAAPRILAAGPQ